MHTGSVPPYNMRDAQAVDAPAKKKDDPRRLHEAAQQFESFMISQMLKSVRENDDAASSTGADSANSSVLGMADDAFAKALSQSGGLGLGRLVEASISHPPSQTKAPGAQQLSE